MGTIVIPDLFVSHPNTEILEALPDLMGSPYITLDPALRVAYFNALYFGLNQACGPGNPSSRAAYYKFLEAVPAWLSADSSSELDGHCAALTVSLFPKVPTSKLLIDRPLRHFTTSTTSLHTSFIAEPVIS